MPTPGLLPADLADVRILGADGAFRFSGLSAGRYGLCALVPPGLLAPTDTPKAAALPGVFSVSQGASRADLGRIVLSR